ncbi:MAG TPA: alpha/beta hydrolase [Chloroflexota bacterium]|nr:alpha/beta hydrolase [Chloroflexota bacterium]
MLIEKRFDTGTCELNYAEGPPAGLPLVLLHGGTSRWQAFFPVIPDLVAHWHIIAPDFRGHGRSDWVSGRYRLEDYVADTLALLKQLRYPAVLVGHSLGGMVGLVVAARAPQSVRAVVVGDTPFSLTNLHDFIARTADEAARRNQRAERPHDPDIHAALTARFADTFAAWAAESILPAVQCPVLLLQADPTQGGLVTDEEVDGALPLLAGVQHRRFTGIDHGLFREPAVLQVMSEFLTALPALT